MIIGGSVLALLAVACHADDPTTDAYSMAAPVIKLLWVR